MSPKNDVETISKIDSMIRVLSKASPHAGILEQADINALNGVDPEDQPKLAQILEDMIVLLKEEPDNKRKILEIHDHIKDGYGHINTVYETLDSVKTYFLEK